MHARLYNKIKPRRICPTLTESMSRPSASGNGKPLMRSMARFVVGSLPKPQERLKNLATAYEKFLSHQRCAALPGEAPTAKAIRTRKKD